MGLLESALRQPLPRVPERLDELSALIDPSWINQALAASGKGSIRSRKLPAEHAVWLVIGLALFRNRPLWQVVEQLDLSLDGQPLPAPSASVQARQRLGEEPLAELSGLLTRAWNRAPRHVHGAPLRVLAVDGVVWPAPDTPDNREQLGSCSTQHGPLPWPQIRATCLMDARSHELLDAKLGGMACGELGLAAQLQGREHALSHELAKTVHADLFVN
ncbi:transposase domain-containing protein [Roseateles sp.]|uniref:transposase domain-containing protein n=1 Tax=Roseateles sp. TaxID=1971397 RepID=UPI00260062D9|nr:transposase domain-containing protein [Roseateles sp.]MBV8036692.1 transposase domain-containing protein [Roseateles sp.]